MRTNYKLPAAKGFIVVNGDLVEVNLVKAVVTDGCVVLTDDKGKEYTDVAVYTNATDYEKGNDYAIDVYGYEGTIVSAYRKNEKGEFVEETIDVTYTATSPIGSVGWCNFVKVFPTGYYETREECIANSNYNEILADGTIVEHKGIALATKLTDEQNEVVLALEKALADAAEKGIRLVYDNCYDELHAINVKEVDVVSAYGGDIEEGVPTLRHSKTRLVKASFSWANDESVLVESKYC